MINKRELLDVLIGELEIIRHLATKIEPQMLSYQPTEKQRTLLELLNYLGHILITGVSLAIAGSTKGWQDLAATAPSVTLENFDTVMADQEKQIREKIEGIADETLKEEFEIFGKMAPRSIHLLNVMKWAVAYKMQLFLYIKANGRHDISTINLWRGVDAPPKEW